MIAIRVYNERLERLGESDNHSSLIWTRRYQAPGEFSVTLPITRENVALFRLGNIVRPDGKQDGGLIERVEMTDDGTEVKMTVTGRFLSCILEKRLIKGTPVKLNGRVSDIMRRLVADKSIVSPLVDSMKDGITLEVYTEGTEVTASFEATYRRVLGYMRRLARASGLGFSITPEPGEKKLVFRSYNGADHSVSQRERNRVVFSAAYRNLLEATYNVDDTDRCTTCFAIADAGDKKYIETLGNASVTGWARREVLIEPSVTKEDDQSDSAFRKAIREAAQDTFTLDYSGTQSMECKALPVGNFVYCTDYDLGDIVTVRADDWGVEADLRLTEVSEVYENGTYTINPTFGDPATENIEWDDSDSD